MVRGQCISHDCNGCNSGGYSPVGSSNASGSAACSGVCPGTRRANKTIDNLAAISSMQGWLAQLQGDLSGSLTSYQHSLSLWQRRHGEEHAFTGWG